MKACIHCHRDLPAEAFRKSSRMVGGRENGCKECHNARRRARYSDAPDRTLECNRDWRSRNTDRLREYAQQWRSSSKTNKRTEKRRAEIAGLADTYVRQLLAGERLKHSDIPQSLVDAYRELIKIKRFINAKRQ